MWPFSKKNKDEQVMLDLPDSGEYSTDVVGESFYQKNIGEICGGTTKQGHKKEVKAVLYCDNDNKHDDNAVRVDIEGLPVGHLSRKDAVDHRKEIEAQGHPEIPVRCSALIVGGWSGKSSADKGSFGVQLDLW